MQTRLRDTTHQLMKALDAFSPFAKNAEEQISMLEGDVMNLTERKKNLDAEILEKIKRSDQLLLLDQKKTKEKLEAAEALFQSAQENYYELYKAKITKILPPVEYGEKLNAKAEELGKKVKEKLHA